MVADTVSAVFFYCETKYLLCQNMIKGIKRTALHLYLIFPSFSLTINPESGFCQQYPVVSNISSTVNWTVVDI